MSRRVAFTILELLVVINVIALLLAISIPAVFNALEAARGLRCQSNLRQLGAALQGYHATHSVMPAAILWDKPGLVISGRSARMLGTVDLTSVGSWQADRSRSSFFVSLLPFVDQHTVYDTWNHDQPGSAPSNMTARSTSLDIFLCPSDGSWGGAACQLSGGNWARGNYAVNAGPDPLCLAVMPSVGPISLPNITCKVLYPTRKDIRGVEIFPSSPLTISQVFGSGIAGVNRCFTFDEMTDGLTKTVILNEILRGTDESDRRGVWAMPYIGSSVTFGHGYWSGGGRPNPNKAVDVIQDGSYDFTPPSDSSREMSLKAHSRSRHHEGVHALMGDGSVHFISNRIDQKVWTAAHTRNNADDSGPFLD